MPEMWMDVDAALSEVPINAMSLIDDTDFKTRKESVTFDQTGLDLVWNFETTAGVFTQTVVTPTDTAGDYDWVIQGNGYYTIEMPASGGASINNDTEGVGYFAGFATGILPWIGPTIGFRSAALNNSLIDGPEGEAPSTRAQVGAIGTSSGGALNFEVTADNASSPIEGVSSVGTETGTFVNTEADDGVYHIITHDLGSIDWIYSTQIGGGRIASEMLFKGFLNSANDSLNIQAFDFIGSEWETRAVLDGQNGTVNITRNVKLLSKHTGTGDDLGTVLIRFVGTGSSPVLNVDELLVEGIGLAQSVGYENGQIWVNTQNGTAGVEAFVNGVAERSSLLWADAQTISALQAVNLTDFHIINGSTITLDATSDNFSLFGNNYIIELNGQQAVSAHFDGATVSGTMTGTGAGFHGGEVGTVTLDNDFHLDRVGLTGTITLPAGTMELEQCHSAVLSPVLDFGAAVGSSTVHINSYAGNLEIHNMGDSGTDIIFLDGMGKLLVDANSSGGTINLRGVWEVENNGGTTINIDDLNSNVIDVKAVTDQFVFTTAGQVDSQPITTAVGSIDAATFDVTALAAIADGVWDAATSGIIESGSMGEFILTVLPFNPPKNTAFNNFPIFLVDDTDHVTPKTGAIVTTTISKDGAAYGASTNSATEISGGNYKINLTAAEMNAEVVRLRFTAADTDDRNMVVFTQRKAP